MRVTFSGGVFRSHIPSLFAVAVLPVLALSVRPAVAGESASAAITVDSLTGPTYDYTITLTNTGDTNIGTFWYAWVDSPAYDFLPSQPTVTSTPSGWIAPVVSQGAPYDGYSIEWYNLNGSPIAPGGSATFKFSSPDSPSALNQMEQTYYNLFHPAGAPIQTAFIYAGFPQTDAGASFVLPEPSLAVSVPEPASLGILAVGGVALLTRKRRRV